MLFACPHYWLACTFEGVIFHLENLSFATLLAWWECAVTTKCKTYRTITSNCRLHLLVMFFLACKEVKLTGWVGTTYCRILYCLQYVFALQVNAAITTFEEHYRVSGTFPFVLRYFVLHPGLYGLLSFQGNTAAGLIKNGKLVREVVHNRSETNKWPDGCFTVSS